MAERRISVLIAKNRPQIYADFVTLIDADKIKRSAGYSYHFWGYRLEILNGVRQTTVTAINEMQNGDVGKFAKPMCGSFMKLVIETGLS